MYKIYNDKHQTSFLCVETLAEVRELTGATNEQIKKLFYRRTMNINGFDVINYHI